MTKLMMGLLTALFGIVALAVAPAVAAQPAPSLRGPDQMFVLDVEQANRDEVALGQLAADKASNPDVKSFAQTMVNDHEKLQDELADLPIVKEAKLPTAAMGAEAKALRVRLNRLSGHAFDQAYMNAMVQDHERDLQTFDRATRNVSNPDLKHWAAVSMTVLREHLQRARKVEQELKSSR